MTGCRKKSVKKIMFFLQNGGGGAENLNYGNLDLIFEQQ